MMGEKRKVRVDQLLTLAVDLGSALRVDLFGEGRMERVLDVVWYEGPGLFDVLTEGGSWCYLLPDVMVTIDEEPWHAEPDEEGEDDGEEASRG